MTILYDPQAFSMQEYGGISRYFGELIAGINKTTEHTAYVVPQYTNNIHFRQHSLPGKPFLANVSVPKKAGFLLRLNKLFAYKALLTQPFDLIHSTYYDPYILPLRKGKPLIITFFDMIHERLHHQFKQLAMDRRTMQHKRLLAKQATRLIAISATTKQDMVDLLDVEPSKITVIHLGHSFHESLAAQEQVPTTNVPYLLYVGNRGFYKNFDTLLVAIQPVLKQYNLRLICAGGGSFTKEERTHIEELRITTLVSQQAVDDRSLISLYQQASVFVFPSLYEGFGLPLLEAFACGCPCIVSSQGSLPEIAAAAAHYFDPTDAESIRTAICQVLDDQTYRANLIQNGKDRLARFSWQRTVEQTAMLYKAVS